MKCWFSFSYRDLEKMMHISSAEIGQPTLQSWARRFARLLRDGIRA
jgi:transposase-like protein